MSDLICGFDANKLAAILEHLDDARTAIKDLKADPIQFIKTTSAADFKPIVYVGSYSPTIEFTNIADEDDCVTFDIEELVTSCISSADAEELDELINLFVRLLTNASNQKTLITNKAD